MSPLDNLWRIAIVDQKSGPPKLWRRSLESDHDVQFFRSCDELLRAFDLNPEACHNNSPHLMIIDWDGCDGHAGRFMKHLRHTQENGTAVLAVVDENKPRQSNEACHAGANEFITRPIDQFELSTRVQNLLIHRPKNLSIPEHYPPFRFDLNRRTVAYNGKLHRPRPREFDLMLYFFRRPNQIIPRSILAERVWLGESDECRSVDTYISRVRRLFGLNGNSGWQIKSVYGKGYCLKPQVDR